MSDTGILYTEHTAVAGSLPIASSWSYETRSREPGRPSVSVNALGDREYWLEHWDPLLNTILPSTHVSLVFNVGDSWAAGRSLARSSLLPRACVIGGITQPLILRLGRTITAVGVVMPPSMTTPVFGVAASALVDQLVPLSDLWPHDVTDRLTEAAICLEPRVALRMIGAEVLGRAQSYSSPVAVGDTASHLLQSRGGRVSIEALAAMSGVDRRQFGREFHASTGMSPKFFARITRFQSLVQSLLSTDVARWASVATAKGFCDQAHMINEFRSFTGSPPRAFFQPRTKDLGGRVVELRGRPSEWLR